MIKFILLAIFCCSQTAFADPISKQEADEWVNFVRQTLGWSADFDVRQEAQERQLRAEQNLIANPSSRTDKRDLADALHTLGHFAEHDHDFKLALSLHERSLQLFKESGLPTRESWNGIEHASEHIFMASYDQYVLLLQRGEGAAAIVWLKKALVNFITSPQVFSVISQMGRVGERLQSFFATASPELKTEMRDYINELKALPLNSCRRIFL